ncbi:hypothetical protein ES703_68291 [subsurface metagenome]
MRVWVIRKMKQKPYRKRCEAIKFIKKYRLYFILGAIIVAIGSVTAILLKNNLIWIVTGIIAIMLCIFLWIYRKKHDVCDIMNKDERQKNIRQMAGHTTFVIFFFGLLLIPAIKLFYPLEKIISEPISAQTLSLILSGIGMAMLFCFAVVYIYYKSKY